MLDLEPATRTLEAVVDGIDDDQLERATPCEVGVAALLVHVLGLCVAFREAGRKIVSPVTDTPPTLTATLLPADWRQQLPVLLDELVRAWREPDAWEGTTRIGGTDLPSAQVGMVANSELVLHAWDLAVASGQRYEPEAANLEGAWQLVSSTPPEPEARAGLFGPPVSVAEDAPLLDRVLAGAGRDPQWSPAA